MTENGCKTADKRLTGFLQGQANLRDSFQNNKNSIVGGVFHFTVPIDPMDCIFFVFKL